MKYGIAKEITANGKIDHGCFLLKISEEDPYYIYDTYQEASDMMQILIQQDTEGRGYQIVELPYL
jgi:hypothetical protein